MSEDEKPIVTLSYPIPCEKKEKDKDEPAKNKDKFKKTVYCCTAATWSN